MSGVRVDREVVMLKLKHLDTKKGVGLDNILPSVLYHCRSLLAEQLSSLFNKSLEKGIFPPSLKIRYVAPLHKSGNRSNITNYRTITILPVMGKLFESLVVDKLNISCLKYSHHLLFHE